MATKAALLHFLYYINACIFQRKVFLENFGKIFLPPPPLPLLPPSRLFKYIVWLIEMAFVVITVHALIRNCKGLGGARVRLVEKRKCHSEDLTWWKSARIHVELYLKTPDQLLAKPQLLSHKNSACVLVCALYIQVHSLSLLYLLLIHFVKCSCALDRETQQNFRGLPERERERKFASQVLR